MVCPWQPSSLDPRGYPGWLREAHLIGDDTGGHDDAPEDESWAVRPGPDGRADLALARAPGAPLPLGRHLPLGLDCSGLVHLVHRARPGAAAGRPRPAGGHRAGRPADASPATSTSSPVPANGHHVGIVTGPYRMIHASERRAVVEEPLDDRRRPTLTAAGRVPG